MIIMKSAAVLAFMASGCAYGQSALERGKKIVDESLAALGGRRYLEMVKMQLVEGDPAGMFAAAR